MNSDRSDVVVIDWLRGRRMIWFYLKHWIDSYKDPSNGHDWLKRNFIKIKIKNQSGELVLFLIHGPIQQQF